MALQASLFISGMQNAVARHANSACHLHKLAVCSSCSAHPGAHSSRWCRCPVNKSMNTCSQSSTQRRTSNAGRTHRATAEAAVNAVRKACLRQHALAAVSHLPQNTARFAGYPAKKLAHRTHAVLQQLCRCTADVANKRKHSCAAYLITSQAEDIVACITQKALPLTARQQVDLLHHLDLEGLRHRQAIFRHLHARQCVRASVLAPDGCMSSKWANALPVPAAAHYCICCRLHARGQAAPIIQVSTANNATSMHNQACTAERDFRASC